MEADYSGPPRPPVLVPAAVRRAARGQTLTPIWENELGGLTFAIGAGAEARYVKWSPPDSGLDLATEARRMRWAAPYTPVPQVIELGNDAEGEWLVTAALPGTNAVVDRWKADPSSAVKAIGRGLRALHDALPVEDCPFSWSAEDRVADARRRAELNLLRPARWNPIHQGLSVAAALELVANAPDADSFVVCHGDACAPNTLLTDDGAWSGHVDLGSLGVADRWADLAVATWSLGWNYGPGWDGLLLDAYGVGPDEERTNYYRLLWDLGA